MIDGYEWNKASDRQRLALIDHELEHLALIENKPTKKEPNLTGFKRDDLGRPKLKTRPHDWELAGFQTIALRHGENSHEARQFAAFRDEFGQLNMFGPNVLQIAEKAGNGKRPKAIDGSKSVVANKPSSKTLDLSNACARRHHPECRYDKCVCACHQKGDSVNG